jgi:hypothetical protein
VIHFTQVSQKSPYVGKWYGIFIYKMVRSLYLQNLFCMDTITMIGHIRLRLSHSGRTLFKTTCVMRAHASLMCYFSRYYFVYSPGATWPSNVPKSRNLVRRCVESSKDTPWDLYDQSSDLETRSKQRHPQVPYNPCVWGLFNRPV